MSPSPLTKIQLQLVEPGFAFVPEGQSRIAQCFSIGGIRANMRSPEGTPEMVNYALR